jgi:hypothetical protein
LLVGASACGSDADEQSAPATDAPADAPPPPRNDSAAIDRIKDRATDRLTEQAPEQPVEEGAGDFEEDYVAGVYEEIRFAPGSNGTTISGALQPGSVDSYYFGASGGQLLSAALLSSDGWMALYDPDFEFIDEGTDIRIDSLPVTGEYTIDVFSESGASIDYDLVLEITGTGGGSASPAECPTYTDFETATSTDYPMRLCQQGNAVRDVQLALNALGYDIVADGFFGPSTADAVGDWRGDGVGELEPADLEALVYFDEGDPGLDPNAAPIGQLSPPSERGYFTTIRNQEVFEPIDLMAGDHIRIDVWDDGDGTDPYAGLWDPFGNFVIENDDVSPGDLAAGFDVTVSATGTYELLIGSIGGSGTVEVSIIIN